MCTLLPWLGTPLIYQGGNGSVVAAGAMLAGFYLHRGVVGNAWGIFYACEESPFEHILSTEAHGVGGYLCHPPINDIVLLVVP